MGLKNYNLRLDEEVYENLKKYLAEHGDPEVNISFLIRRYLSDVNESLPNLKKSPMSLLNHIAFWGAGFKELARTARLEHMIKGAFNIDMALEKEEKKGKKKGGK